MPRRTSESPVGLFLRGCRVHVSRVVLGGQGRDPPVRDVSLYGGASFLQLLGYGQDFPSWSLEESLPVSLFVPFEI